MKRNVLTYSHVLTLQVAKEQKLRHIEIKVVARRRQSIIHTRGGVRNYN